MTFEDEVFWNKMIYGKEQVETTVKNAAKFSHKLGGWWGFASVYYHMASFFWKKIK